MPTKAVLERTVADQQRRIQEQNVEVEQQRQEIHHQRELIDEIRAQLQQLQLQQNHPHNHNHQQHNDENVVADQHEAPPDVHHHQQQQQAPPRPQAVAAPAVAPPPVNPQVPNQPLQQLIQQINPQQPIQVNYYAPAVGNNRLLCRQFTGIEKSVSPEAWLSLFEHRAANEPLDQRYKLFGDHLAGEAEDWYLRQYGVLGDNPDWNVVREHFVTFFSTTIEAPGVAAARLKFKVGDDLEKYFQTKNRYFDLAKTQLEDRIAFLTEGCVEDAVRDGLIVATIDNLSQWLKKAKALVANLERKRARTQSRFTLKPGPSNANSSPQNRNSSTKPNTPCRICKEKNVTAFHWHVNCPNKKPTTTPKIAQHVKIDSPQQEIISPSSTQESSNLNE